jgi:hypothetical protein
MRAVQASWLMKAARLLHLGWFNDAGSRPVAGVEARGPNQVYVRCDGPRGRRMVIEPPQTEGRLMTAFCHDAVANLRGAGRIRLKSCPYCAGGSFAPKVRSPQRPVGVGERATSWSSCLVLGDDRAKFNRRSDLLRTPKRRWDDLSLDNVVTFAVFAGDAYNGSTGGLVNWAGRSSCCL